MSRLLWPTVILAAMTGCSVKWHVHQPIDVQRACSAVALPIAANKSQEEYLEAHFPAFREGFLKTFRGRLQVKEWEGGKKGLTWEEAVAVGRGMGVDVVVGILIDDSERPPDRMEILNVVKASNGKVIARQNRLIAASDVYKFKDELDSLARILRCEK